MLVSSQSNQSHMTAQKWSILLAQSAKAHRHLWFLVGLGVAFCPVAIIGILSHDWIEANLFSSELWLSV